MNVTSYSDTLTVTKEEMAEARSTAPTYRGLAFLAAENRRLELAEHLERESLAAWEAYDKALAQYEKDQLGVPAKRDALFAREDARLARGLPFTEGDRDRLLRELEAIYPKKPISPLEHLLGKRGQQR